MNLKQPIPPYRSEKRQATHKRAVVVKEFRKQDKKLRAATSKVRKLKEKCTHQAAQLEKLKRFCEQEQANARHREMKLTLRAKLDAWVFYHGEDGKESK